MNRDFKGIWIPREVWLNKKLSIQAKALWAEIWSLHDRESGGCYASNDYLCEFMNVKITRLKEVMKELRDEGLLIDVHFDGRQRIIQALVPEAEYTGQQHAGIPASSMPVFRPADSRFSGQPSLYLDTSIEQRLEKTPLVSPQVENAAKAACGAKKASPTQFSQEVKEMAKKMIAIIAKHSSVYRPPDDMTKFLKAVQDLLEKDKQDPAEILRTFEWAVSDSEQRDSFKGWQGIIVTNKKGGKVTNPVEIFRGYFSKIHSNMKARPVRKFAPSSSEERMRRATEEANKGAI